MVATIPYHLASIKSFAWWVTVLRQSGVDRKRRKRIKKQQWVVFLFNYRGLKFNKQVNLLRICQWQLAIGFWLLAVLKKRDGLDHPLQSRIPIQKGMVATIPYNLASRFSLLASISPEGVLGMVFCLLRCRRSRIVGRSRIRSLRHIRSRNRFRS